MWISHKQGFDKGSFSSEKKKWETDLGVTLTMKNADGHKYVYPSKYVYFYRCTEKKKNKERITFSFVFSVEKYIPTFATREPI